MARYFKMLSSCWLFLVFFKIFIFILYKVTIYTYGYRSLKNKSGDVVNIIFVTYPKMYISGHTSKFQKCCMLLTFYFWIPNHDILPWYSFGFREDVRIYTWDLSFSWCIAWVSICSNFFKDKTSYVMNTKPL